ncbi:MAG: tRNA 4-thiouridine(8) synthase ThiI [Candidatus Paceibacterota bacterium]
MKKNEKKVRALVLMSGGLDSMLAGKILEFQGMKTTLICFKSYFFSEIAAQKSARALGMELRVEDISVPHLEIVKHPRYGYGGAVNPCIDCHLLMLKTAKAIMNSQGFDFVATGEVLGERPMSQNKLSLDIIEKESGLAGFLLRPLSALLLPPTIAETKGLIDRNQLYGISGRSRKVQMELAEKFNIKYVPQPGGGCILTEKEYGQRLGQLMTKCPNFDGSDAQLLRHCRPIWEEDMLFAVARDQDDCAALKKLAKTKDYIFEPKNFPGSTVLARNFGKAVQGATLHNSKIIEELGKKYLLQYSKKIPVDPEININYL